MLHLDEMGGSGSSRNRERSPPDQRQSAGPSGGQSGGESAGPSAGPSSLLTAERHQEGEQPRGFPLCVLIIKVEKFLCGLCLFILREPVQNECGHRFCRACLANVAAGTKCDQCQKEGEQSILNPKSFFPDPAVRREMYTQAARCDSENCKWTGKFKEYLTHISKCEFKLVKCECLVDVVKAKLDEHRRNSCSLREIVCSYCTAQVIARDMSEHLNTCPSYPIECPNQCGTKLPRSDIDAHVNRQTGNCERRACTFGCSETERDHEKHHVVRHAHMLLEKVQDLQAKTEESKNRSTADASALNTRVELVEGNVSSLSDKLAQIIAQNEQPQPNQSQAIPFGTQVRSVKQSAPHVDRRDLAVAANAGPRLAIAGAGIPNIEMDLAPFGIAGQPSEIKSLSAIQQKQNVVEGLAAVLNREVEKLIVETNNLEHQRRLNSETMETLSAKLTSIERGVALKDIAMAEQELRLKELEMTTFDGKLMWVITDFSRKRQDAISGRTPSIYSTPFYTSRAGYKMCARIYLNGDGMGKGSHISLFFVVMRGQYDAILPWPFKQKTTFMMMDQGGRDHVVDSFRPDPNSSSFRRPQSNMNIASGVPMFCPLSRLEDRRQNYIKDDTLFIKIAVDLTGI